MMRTWDEIVEEIAIEESVTKAEADICFDSDVLPWPPCASHTWYRYGPTSVTCANCDYSAYVPSPVAEDENGEIPDDMIPNPPRPRLKGRRP
jgi:hypothetical protein